MEQITRKTAYQRKLDSMAADFIKTKLPYRATIELRAPNFQYIDEVKKKVHVPIKLHGTITHIDHINVRFDEDGQPPGLTISFEEIHKILPYEKPKD